MTTTLAPPDFDFVCQLVRRRSAIVLEPGKEYLVEARLSPLAKELGFGDPTELVAQLRRDTGPLADRVTEAMTTNETSFFRDIVPFDLLRQEVLPELVVRRATQRRLRIWCGASSSGQEPYTIAMVVDQVPELAGWDIEILATDLSPEMLDRARSGLYSQLEVNRGLPAQLLVKHFERSGTGYQLKEGLRRSVEFRMLNLAEPWPTLGPFDIVFMRNVLIYFDVETKREIFGRVRRVLAPDGYLFLGAAETTVNIDAGFERLPRERAGCYVLRA